MSTPLFHRAWRTCVFLLASATTTDAAERLADPVQAMMAARPAQPAALAPLHATPCVGGMAAGYPCSNVDLLAFVPVATFSATSTNSLWGWTDAQSGIEYALVGANNSTAFFSLEQPDHPLYLGRLLTHTGNSIWRDVRVYANHAYIVSDNNGAHGMQVFDLTQLRAVTSPQTFAETAFVGGFGRGHTIAINEDTGFGYVAGSDTCPAPTQNGGLRMYDLHVPTAPVFVGCIATGGYTHETQCWTYAGPDLAHQGKELCFNANGNSGRFAIVDVSVKSAPITLSSTPYAGSSFTHQGWLTEDHRYFLVNDELDETSHGHQARTYVFDVADLDAPVLVGYHQHAFGVIDHNLYVHGDFVYESNYEAGLRILRLGNLSQAQMTEIAYFDTWPQSDTAEFNGNWNHYRFPGSGNVIATGIDEGLFVLQPHLCTPRSPPTGLMSDVSTANQIGLSWDAVPTKIGTGWRVERAQGGCDGRFSTVADGLSAPAHVDTTASGQVSYGYRVVALAEQSVCSSVASACVVAQTTGACTAAPVFSGLSSIIDAGTATCEVQLQWQAASPACGGEVSYSVYRSDTADFTPTLDNRIASQVTGPGFVDRDVSGTATSFYIVRATDAASGSEDTNRATLSVHPTGPQVDGTFGSGAEPGDSPFDTLIAPAGGNDAKAVQHAGWHTSLSRVHSGAQSFWSTAANNLCVTLVTPPLVLTSGQASQLDFWHAWDIEQGWDGGVIEISTDNGAQWTRLTPSGGYSSTITNGGTLCGITQGSAAFTGEGNLGWSQRQINLASYAGQSVQIRWLYRTDGGALGEGWFIDDIAVTHAQVPGICTGLPDEMFANGFD